MPEESLLRADKSPSSALPRVRVTSRGASRLRDGYLWVYRSDVISAETIPAGSVVTVFDDRGKALGTAFYSSTSQIAVRLISREIVGDTASLVRKRIVDAIQYREKVVRNSNAYRVIFSEGDFLPGIIVDRYAEILSLQILTQATDSEWVRRLLISELSARLQPDSIVERVDARVRELESLPPRASGLIEGEKTSTVVTMNGVQFHYDSLEGQKTGAFLDQRENYAAAAEFAYGELLDVCCYQGGFALHLAPKCVAVTGVDISRPALEAAERNAILNSPLLDGKEKEIEWIEANAFDLLKDYAAAGKHYDTVVLDPPAFAKSKRDLDSALRGYKELNLRALKMLRPGGILVTCSCSYHVSSGAFLEMLATAALDAHRVLRLIELRGQAKDHPVVPGVPETAYLKCAVLSVTN